MICSKCHTNNPNDLGYCQKCGERLIDVQYKVYKKLGKSVGTPTVTNDLPKEEPINNIYQEPIHREAVPSASAIPKTPVAPINTHKEETDTFSTPKPAKSKAKVFVIAAVLLVGVLFGARLFGQNKALSDVCVLSSIKYYSGSNLSSSTQIQYSESGLPTGFFSTDGFMVRFNWEKEGVGYKLKGAESGFENYDFVMNYSMYDDMRIERTYAVSESGTSYLYYDSYLTADRKDQYQRYFDEDGNIISATSYNYDENGRVRSKIYEDENGVSYIEYYTYDDGGNERCVCTSYKDRSYVSVNTKTYNGGHTKERQYGTVDIGYDSIESMLESPELLNLYDRHKEVAEIDSDGRLISLQHVDADNSVYETDEYKYDSDGNPLSVEQNRNGSIDRTEYSYIQLKKMPKPAYDFYNNNLMKELGVYPVW